jgi:hypothetical protein
MCEMKTLPANIQKWVDELRAENHAQTTGTLKRNLSDGKVGYCCLGVYVEKVKGKKIKAVSSTSKKEGADKWYGVCEKDILSYIRKLGVEMNDTGHTFAEIADMIETEYQSIETREYY